MMLKAFLVVFTIFVAHVSCLSYNWPTNPSHTPIMKAHLTALFGPQSYAHVTGPVMVAEPANFCEVPSWTIAVGILLVERGNCTFYQKAQNAMRVGAFAIVIANTLEMVENLPDFPLRMGYPPTENPSAITIPVVSITAHDFVLIQKAIQTSNQTLSIYLEQTAGTGAGGDVPGGGSNNGGNTNPDHPPQFGGDDEPVPNVSGRSGHYRHSKLMTGAIISAIVVSSCLCGFCCGRRSRRCGRGRRGWCRRQQQLAAQGAINPMTVPVEASAPSQTIVHGGERYVQVDMSSAPVAYYGEQEMAPVPSAPPIYLAGNAPTSPSFPNSAPSNYA
jgi:hypothetical protein